MFTLLLLRLPQPTALHPKRNISLIKKYILRILMEHNIVLLLANYVKFALLPLTCNGKFKMGTVDVLQKGFALSFI